MLCHTIFTQKSLGANREIFEDKNEFDVLSSNALLQKNVPTLLNQFEKEQMIKRATAGSKDPLTDEFSVESLTIYEIDPLQNQSPGTVRLHLMVRDPTSRLAIRIGPSLGTKTSHKGILFAYVFFQR